MALHPYDQETLVTAGDDRLLKVWRSRNRQAEIARGEYLSETVDWCRMRAFGRGDLAEGDESSCDRSQRNVQSLVNYSLFSRIKH